MRHADTTKTQRDICKGRHVTALPNNCASGSHSVTCTRRKWTHPTLTPARQAGARFTYPGWMEGWVDLGLRCFCLEYSINICIRQSCMDRYWCSVAYVPLGATRSRPKWSRVACRELRCPALGRAWSTMTSSISTVAVAGVGGRLVGHRRERVARCSSQLLLIRRRPRRSAGSVLPLYPPAPLLLSVVLVNDDYNRNLGKKWQLVITKSQHEKTKNNSNWNEMW